MDELQQRIQEDLSGILKGEVRCDPITTAIYSNDASLYEIRPMGVVFPVDEEDVVTLAQYASTANVPLVARGAGTGLAGAALGQGIIVDFSRHMNKILEVGNDFVVVQPGVVLDDLNNHLRETGKYFAPDPSNASVTTLGGMLGVDAAGSRAIRVGSTRGHVINLNVVLANGNWMRVGEEPLSQLRSKPASILDPTQSASQAQSTNGNGKRLLISRLKKLLLDNKKLIDEKQPALIRNCAGYYLRNILTDDHLNLAKIFVGSEGTLGLTTAAKLHIIDRPAHRGAALLLFGQLQKAVETVQTIIQSQPSACDLLDRRILSLAREADKEFQSLIPAGAEAAILVEQVGFTDVQMRRRLSELIATVRKSSSSPLVAQVAHTPEEVDFLWSLPRTVVPHLSRLTGETKPIPFIEDIALPPEQVSDFLKQSQRIFQRHQVTASLYAHAATGQLHLRPFMSSPARDQGKSMEALARDLYQVVFDHGGTISGEHGDGLSRTAFLRSQYGVLYRVFKEVKNIFDPHNLLNPGKIISDDPHITRKHLRPLPASSQQDSKQQEETKIDLHLNWQKESAQDVANHCNGCGHCKTNDHELRMCPFFRDSPSEATSPRSKANLVRLMTSQQLEGDQLTNETFQEISKSCFNCKQCEIECPTQVNIPQLMIEAKAAHVAANGLTRADWILSRAHSFGKVGTLFPFFTNAILRNKMARWLIEKTLGIAKKRKLPSFASQPFLGSIDRKYKNRDLALVKKQNAKTKPIVFFVDHYANFYDPSLAKAFLKILEHHEINVYVPPEQTASGMASISIGDIDAARNLAEQNLRAMGELAREGFQIVCTEATAALCLKKEYPQILQHPDVEELSKQTIEAGAYLKQLYNNDILDTKFQPVSLSVGYHLPCHVRALYQKSHYTEILNLIPDLKINHLDKGCSGMAGAFGITQNNFETSLRLGKSLIEEVKTGPYDVGCAECSSCKMQMEQETDRPTLHPLKIIAHAYGLLPDWKQTIQTQKKRKTVS